MNSAQSHKRMFTSTYHGADASETYVTVSSGWGLGVARRAAGRALADGSKLPFQYFERCFKGASDLAESD